MKKFWLLIPFFLFFMVASKISVSAAPLPASSLGTGGGSQGADTSEAGIGIFNPIVNQQQATGNTALQLYQVYLINGFTNAGTRMIVGNGLGTAGATAGNPILNFQNNGAIGTMAYAIGGLYENKPASTVDYINNIAQNAGFSSPIRPAYAAGPGIGFTSLTPILKLWQLVRNITYLIFAVIFVVIGLMIILRVKIDPKTVISIQTALPQIIWSLVLITFSYPIAGFLIDIMYVLIGVILSVVSAGGLIKDVSSLSNNLQNESIFGFVGLGNWWSLTKMSGSAIQNIVNDLLGVLNLGGSVGSIIGALVGLIIAIAILYALVRTWFFLLGAYVNILIGVIFSPLAMLGEAIPGVSGLGLWLRAMLSNLLAFPLVVVLLVFGQSIMEYGTQNVRALGSENGFIPPLVGGNNPAAITALIGLGILLMIPKAVYILQDLLKSPPFKYGMALSESTGFGATVGTAPMRERAYQNMYNRALADPLGWTGIISRSVIGYGAERKLWGPPPRLPENAQPGPG